MWVVKFPAKMQRIFNKNYKDLLKYWKLLKNSFKPTLAQKFSRIKVYNALALPILLRESEVWTLRKKDQ